MYLLIEEVFCRQITKIRLCPHQSQNRKVPHLRKARKSNKLCKSENLRICETYLRNLFGTRIISYNMFLRRKISYHMNVIFLFFIRSYIFPEKRITMKIGKWGDM